MRCRCCDSPEAKWIHYWQEYYCEDCKDSIDETISEDEELEEFMEDVSY